MKKIAFITIILMISNVVNAQQILPAVYTMDPTRLDTAWYFHTALSADFSGSKDVLTNGLPAGTVVSFGHRYRDRSKPESNFLINIDFNPIIIGWSPFKWTNLAKVKVDTFFLNKLPFAENCVLHFGFRYNQLRRVNQMVANSRYQRWLFSLFGESYFSPYNIDKENINYKFTVVNTSAGFQIGYFDKSIPYLIALSFHYDCMFVNETDQYYYSFRNTIGSDIYKGRNFQGGGMKFLAQFPGFLKSKSKNKDFINLYVEMRQYFAMDNLYKNDKLTKLPILLFGGYYDIAWNVGKKNLSETKIKEIKEFAE